MRHSYLRIEEVDEGESKRKIKTINNKNVVVIECLSLTSSGSASAAITTNSEIPRFKVLVASLAPYYDLIFAPAKSHFNFSIEKSRIFRIFFLDKSSRSQEDIALLVGLAMHYNLKCLYGQKMKSFLFVIACNWLLVASNPK